MWPIVYVNVCVIWYHVLWCTVMCWAVLTVVRCDILWCDITSCHVMSCHVMSWDLMCDISVCASVMNRSICSRCADMWWRGATLCHPPQGHAHVCARTPSAGACMWDYAYTIYYYSYLSLLFFSITLLHAQSVVCVSRCVCVYICVCVCSGTCCKWRPISSTIVVSTGNIPLTITDTLFLIFKRALLLIQWVFLLLLL